MSALNGNGSDVIDCKLEVPTSTELIKKQSLSSSIALCIIWLSVVITLVIFIEEVIFIAKTFKDAYRKRKTIYVIMLAPVYSLSAIIGVMIPRAGPLIDLVMNSFCGLVFYSMTCLIGDYLGAGRLTRCLDGSQTFALDTFPCCCCCPCLSKPAMTRTNYIRLLVMIYQVTLTRPILSFLAAVLWVDGRYIPGEITADNAFPYLATLNTISTLTSIWGLIIIQKAFRPMLARYVFGLKFLFLQLALLGTLTGNVIIASLVSTDVIPCTDFIPSSARAQRLDNSFVVVWMVLVAFCGWVAFRRYGDAFDDDDQSEQKMEQTGSSKTQDGTTEGKEVNPSATDVC